MDHKPTSDLGPDDQPTIDPSSQEMTSPGSPGTPSPTPSDRPNDIGPYKILETLGEGGMGVVYLAEQLEPIKRRVALKVIKLGMDTKSVVARFEAERQALAMMDHPNVAKVFDGGMTDQGRPYFVMEHVPGVPITEHCDRQRLSIDERLTLFMRVCEAVQHAHQKGIIHRDLKPSNILVSVRDGEAAPRVIDFGVAKALHQRLTEKTMYTEQGQIIGTPEYMSPEQAEMNAQDIDTRSDIYSLGVLLYQLLTGALPFDQKTLRGAAYGEIQRIIREVEPPRPSTRISGLGDASEENARMRHAEPRSLAGEVRGDLDWIVMRCLEKDRTRRYETANGLAADIRRHMANEPVLAGPPSSVYRMRKFVRRNRVGVVAVSAVMLVLLVGVVGTTWGLIQASRARDAEAQQRVIAERETANAQAISTFLTEDLLASVAPTAGVDIGQDSQMQGMLDAASAKIDEAGAPGGRFADNPKIEAPIRAALGWTYLRLGEYEKAESHLRRVVAIYLQVYGETDPGTLGHINQLGWLYLVQGRYIESESLLVRAIDVARRVHGESDPVTLKLMYSLGHTLTKMGRLDEAGALFRTLSDAYGLTYGEEHPRTLSVLGSIAGIEFESGHFDEAESILVQLVETNQRVLGKDHPTTLVEMYNLGNVYLEQGRYDHAESVYAEMIRLGERVFGETHPQVFSAKSGLAYSYIQLGRTSEAEDLLVEIIAQGASLWSHLVLVELCLEQGRIDDARPLLRAAVQRDGNSDASADDKNGLSWILLTAEPAELRDPVAALRLAQGAVRMTGGANPPYLDTLALAQRQTGDIAGAIETQKKALSLLAADASNRGEYEATLAEYEAELSGEE